MSNINFENKVRTFLYHKGLISKPVYEPNLANIHSLRNNKVVSQWNSNEYKKGKHNFGVHLEVSSDNPYHCFEVYSEASKTEPDRKYWEKIQSNWQKVFKRGKKEMKSLFGKKVPNLTVELYIVDYKKQAQFGSDEENDYDSDLNY